jgi:very-short-patch-repair endonuclease
MRAHGLAELSRIASRQHGCFARAQAHESGVSDHHLRQLVRRGVIERAAPAVFRFSAATRTWLQDVMIACLDGGAACLASHRTAAALHGLDGFRHGGIVEVVVPMHVRHRRSGIIVHHSRALSAADRSLVGSIPVTSVARTLIDLGAVVPATTVEEAMDSAELRSLVHREHLLSRYAQLRAPGRNGIGAMTLILGSREALRRIPRSVLERRMLRLLDRANLPKPTTRFVLRIGDRVIELDFAYAELLFALEVDGHGTHASRRDRAADNERQAAIEDAGWMIRRFTYEQVMYDEPYVVATVRAALEVARNRL